MSQERLTVRKIKEVLRLKWECQISERSISRSCRISRSTVSEYVKRAEAAGLKWPLSEEITDNQLYERLFPRTIQLNPKAAYIPDWQVIHLELRKKM